MMDLDKNKFKDRKNGIIGLFLSLLGTFYFYKRCKA